MKILITVAIVFLVVIASVKLFSHEKNVNNNSKNSSLPTPIVSDIVTPSTSETKDYVTKDPVRERLYKELHWTNECPADLEIYSEWEKVPETHYYELEKNKFLINVPCTTVSINGVSLRTFIYEDKNVSPPLVKQLKLNTISIPDYGEYVRGTVEVIDSIGVDFNSKTNEITMFSKWGALCHWETTYKFTNEELKLKEFKEFGCDSNVADGKMKTIFLDKSL